MAVEESPIIGKRFGGGFEDQVKVIWKVKTVTIRMCRWLLFQVEERGVYCDFGRFLKRQLRGSE